MAAVVGMGGDVSIGDGTSAVDLEVMEWSADYSADKLDITNVASGGNREYTLGPKDFSGSFKAVWDAEINAGAPPFNVVKPQIGVPFALAIGADGGTLTFTGGIEKMSITNAADGVVEYTGDFFANGAVVFTAPA